jgi:hypothetical protein
MLHIGWATREFTPARPAMLQGQMHRRIARSALDPLTITAWAIEGQAPTDSTLFISCDLVGIPDELCGMVRERLAKKMPELPANQIIMNGTHTHTSLVIEDGWYDAPDSDVMTPKECLAWVADCAIEAAAEAWETRKPGVLGRAFGHAVVGHNRHAVYTDRHAEMYGQTNREDFAWIGGYEDHSLDMLFTWDPQGALTGIALAIPCPSQVDEHLEQFSADYWHDVRVELRKRLGAQLQILPICSAAGDQSPHFLIYGKQEEEMRLRRGVSERQEIARRVADAVEFALVYTHPVPAGENPLAHRVQTLALTPWRITKAQRDWAQATYEQWTAKGDTTSWWPNRLHWVVDCFEGRETAQPVHAEIHVVRIGDAVIATSPFELSLDYGMQIKARSQAVQTLTMQLASGSGMYLPSERAAQGGGYGAMPAVADADPEGGRELVTATLALIQDVCG